MKILLVLLLFALLLPARGPARAQADAPVASYSIDVRLDVETRQLSGVETITYANRSDTPIPDLVFHLYLNAFRDQNSLFLRESGGMHRGFGWSPERAGWIEIEALRVQDGPELSLEPLEDGTLARAALPQPVAPGQSISLQVAFRAQLPGVFARTGWAVDAAGQPFFMVGQWFPKLGVWQGARGWNAYPLHANSEFFADFGDYDVTIHLPQGYTVGATGMPVGEAVIANGSQSLRYQAGPVIDFAWTASPSTRAAARTIRLPAGDLELLYLVLPEHAWTVERVLAAAETAMRNFSQWFGPYPYPRLTIVDVPDAGAGAGGMEYPTLITAGTLDLGLPEFTTGWERTLELVVIHEAGHQWFMGLLASNEAEEPWLDEGFTDYATVRLVEQVYGPGRSAVDLGELRAGYLDMRRMEYLSDPEVPMYGRAWDFGGMQYGIASYSKPALGLLTLEGVLGEESMLRVLAAYTRQYRFAHPTTEDFRRVAEETSGQDLAWFFDGLVYGTGTLNYRAEGIDARSLRVARDGQLVIPTEIQLTFQDGSSRVVAWDGRETPATFTFPTGSALLQAEIDPQRKLLVDQTWTDNGLRTQPDRRSWLAVFSGLIYHLQDLLLMLGGL